MKKISTRVYRENFTGNGVTPRHFVTTEAGCDQALPIQRHLEPVTRRYKPEAVVLDELVEALYQLLIDAPANESAPGGSTCFPAAHK
jgi:hypothetical protein